MFVDLIDHLRCTNPHEDVCMVAAAVRTVQRDIEEGLLGCPVCRAEFPIRGGVAYFAERPSEPVISQPDAQEAMRLAAFLDLSDPRGFAALVGDWASNARQVQSLTDVHLVLVNPPSGMIVGGGTSGVSVASVMPFSRSSLRAIAFDERVDAALVASALLALRGKARVLGPVSMPVPPGVTELVRDDRVWVGERDPELSPLTSLGRR